MVLLQRITEINAKPHYIWYIYMYVMMLFLDKNDHHIIILRAFTSHWPKTISCVIFQWFNPFVVIRAYTSDYFIFGFFFIYVCNSLSFVLRPVTAKHFFFVQGQHFTWAFLVIWLYHKIDIVVVDAWSHRHRFYIFCFLRHFVVAFARMLI